MTVEGEERGGGGQWWIALNLYKYFSYYLEAQEPQIWDEEGDGKKG